MTDEIRFQVPKLIDISRLKQKLKRQGFEVNFGTSSLTPNINKRVDGRPKKKGGRFKKG